MYFISIDPPKESTQQSTVVSSQPKVGNSLLTYFCIFLFLMFSDN